MGSPAVMRSARAPEWASAEGVQLTKSAMTTLDHPGNGVVALGTDGELELQEDLRDHDE